MFDYLHQQLAEFKMQLRLFWSNHHLKSIYFKILYGLKLENCIFITNTGTAMVMKSLKLLQTNKALFLHHVQERRILNTLLFEFGLQKA
jgi:hypothetical protein